MSTSTRHPLSDAKVDARRHHPAPQETEHTSPSRRSGRQCPSGVASASWGHQRHEDGRLQSQGPALHGRRRVHVWPKVFYLAHVHCPGCTGLRTTRSWDGQILPLTFPTIPPCCLFVEILSKMKISSYFALSSELYDFWVYKVSLQKLFWNRHFLLVRRISWISIWPG